jgi:hypothetical protein
MNHVYHMRSFAFNFNFRGPRPFRDPGKKKEGIICGGVEWWWWWWWLGSGVCWGRAARVRRVEAFLVYRAPPRCMENINIMPPFVAFRGPAASFAYFCIALL